MTITVLHQFNDTHADGADATLVRPSNWNAWHNCSYITNLINGVSRTLDAKIGEGLISVKDFGAVGNGIADDTTAIQNAFNAVFPAGAVAQGILYFPPGTYKITTPISIVSMFNGIVWGAGTYNTIIKNTAGGNVINTDGSVGCFWQGITFMSSGSAVLFNLDWTGGGPVSLQENRFNMCAFDTGAVGVDIGHSGHMGSENVFFGCFCSSLSSAAYKASNQNALQNTVIAGNIESCPSIGIWVPPGGGSFPNILGVGFQNGANGFDIQVESSSNDCYDISGCRSESVNFANFPIGTARITGVNHGNATNGTFVQRGANFPDPIGIDCCSSTKGILASGLDSMYDVSNSAFGRNPFCASGASGRIRNSWYGGLPDLLTVTYVYDAFFSGNGSTNGFDSTQGAFGGNLLSGAYMVSQNAGDQNGYLGKLVGDTTNARFRLDFDAGDRPELCFGPGGSSGADVFLNRQGAKQFGIGSSATATDGTITLTNVTTVAVLVSALPAAGVAGRRATVTNATQTLTAGIGTVVAGGGGNTVPVFDDGTNWRIG